MKWAGSFRTGALAMAIGMAATAQVCAQDAQQWQDRIHFGASGTVAFPDEDARSADSAAGVELRMSWQLTDHWGVQAATSYFNYDTGIAALTDHYRSAANVDAVLYFRKSGWQPFMLLGIGGVYNDVYPNDGDGIRLTGRAGLGLMTRPLGTYGLRLRLEGQYVHDRSPGHPSEVHALAGVMIPLRRPREVVRTEVREVEVIKEVVREIPPPPPPPPPADSDGDGVPDHEDRCPDTLPGTTVDRQGCAVERSVVVLQGVHFETGSDRLTHHSLTVLAQAAAALKGQPTMRVEVGGHTDWVGTDEYNLDLSQRRAQSVVNFLVESGVERERLVAVGYGEARPVADNRTPEGRASNRRVEFKVLSR